MKNVITIFVIFAIALSALAKDNPFAKADSLNAAGNWSEAEKAYKSAMKNNDAAGREWFRLGLSQHMQGKYNDAIQSYEKALEKEFAPGITNYNIACSNALMGNTDKAYAHLEKAYDVGFRGADLAADPDLASLRGDERWANFMQKVDEKIHPCQYNPKARELDFWIGEWNVSFSSSGSAVGVNQIVKEEAGCILRESWNPSQGSTGMSINYYDPSKDKWVQNWNDAGGGWIHYEGNLKDGSMVFVGDAYNSATGEINKSRMTLTPQNDGTVRQIIEGSQNGGTTWNTQFDGIYKKMTDAVNR